MPSTLTINDPHDYVQVFLDNQLMGRIDRVKNEKTLPMPAIRKGQRLSILVEAMGRINFGRAIKDHKGITDNVTLSGETDNLQWEARITDWKMLPIPDDYATVRWAVDALTRVKEYIYNKTIPQDKIGYYRGYFNLKKVGDTFLNMEAFGKGQVYINGYAIGRFWNIGPQQTLYVPGCWLKKGQNEVIVLDMVGPKGKPVLFAQDKPELDKLNLEKSNKHNNPGNRPDLRAAQYRLQQNLGNIAIAERDYYPDLTLGANLGTSANRLLELLHNPIGAISANITLPFLNAHKKELARREAETSYQQNLANYRQTLYRALGETQNAILNLKQSQDEARHLQERLAQAKDIENLTRIRYQAGAASLQDVLDKENATRGVEESLLTNRYEQLTRSLTLHLALGGNLQDNESARPQPSPTAREGE